MACLPAYNPTDSSLDVDPTTHRSPSAYLPSYSAVAPSYWLEEAAPKVLRTSHDFDDIKLVVKFTPGLDSTTAATLLSRRRKGWLDAFLHTLCRDEAVEKPLCNPPLSTAEAIVVIIRQRLSSPALGWNGDWILSALLSSSDIPTIAEKFVTQIHSTFCMFPLEDWAAWCCGYRNDAISNFLDTVFNFRNKLARYVQQHAAIADKLLLLQKVLLSQNPLPSWIVSTTLSSDTSSNPSEALQFFLSPIYQLLNEQPSGILPIVRKLSILDTRFKLKVINETDVNWPKPFSTDFLFWESIQRDSPKDLAKSNTESVSSLYFAVSPRDLLYDGKLIKDIASLWSDLSDDILACLVANGKLMAYFVNFAEYLLLLRNVHSAAAVGLALAKWGYQPRNTSPVWEIINPKDNFAGCRDFMVKNPACLPYLFPYIRELRRLGNAAEKILEFYQMIVGYLESTQGAKVGQIERVEEKTMKKDIIACKYSPCQITHSSSSWAPERSTRSVAQDLDVGPSPNSSMSLYHSEKIESFARFPRLPLNIQHSIWKESLPEPRIFDNDTLQLLKPRQGVICLDLIPSMLQVCQESRAFAQGRLRRTFLFQTWAPNRKRTLYFDPEHDIYKFHFADLLWRRGSIPSQCLFGCVEIIANIRPEQLTGPFGYGLKSVEFHNTFPNLKRLIITNQHTNLLGDVLRNGWSEAQWKRESRLNQRNWDQEWEFVRNYFEGRNILITTSPSIPQADGRQPADSTYVLDTRRDECLVDTDTNLGVSSELELPRLIYTRNVLSPRAKSHSQASPQHEMSQATIGKEFGKEGEVDSLDPDITPGPSPSTTEYLIEYLRADRSYVERVLRVYDEQSFTGSETTEATEVAPENEIKAMMERNFPIGSKQGTSGGIAAKIEHPHSSIQEFAKPCREQGAHGFDQDNFDSNEHLIFSPPDWVWSLADMQLSDDNATSSFAVSGAFSLFSAAAIERMREELLTNKVQQMFQTSNSTVVRRQLRGMAPKHAKFTYNAWNHPDTLAAISKVAGIDLVPVMDIEVSHLNILGSNSLRNKHSVGWHQDDYPYACVLMLSDTTHITGGHTLLKMGSATAVCDRQKMGFAYVLQGRCIQHAIQAFEGYPELIIAVTSFRPRNPFLQDQTQLSNVHTISDSSQLCFQFCQYRWDIAIERLTALRQILEGKEVLGWVWNSPLLGENVEEIRRFLHETRKQLGMTGNNAPIPTKSKSNAIDLTNCATEKLDLYSFGLCQGIERLVLGVEQQQGRAEFNARLAQSTFERVDYILRNTCESVGA